MKLYLSFNTVNGKGCCNGKVCSNKDQAFMSFNTVNGKGCCNYIGFNFIIIGYRVVSIP